MANYTHWTPEMNDYLKDNFRLIGDTKLAELFEHKFTKCFHWTKKHIEKRRTYMKLKRTAKEENRLRVMNNKDGRQDRMWLTRGAAKEGEIKHWKDRKFIKVSGRWVDYYRHIANAKPGQVVRHYEGDLKIITLSENQAMNARLRANRHPELKSTIKALNQLKKILYGKENRGPARNAV